MVSDRLGDDREPPRQEFIGRVVTDDGGIVSFVTISNGDPQFDEQAAALADAQIDALAGALPEGMALVDHRGEEVASDD